MAPVKRVRTCGRLTIVLVLLLVSLEGSASISSSATTITATATSNSIQYAPCRTGLPVRVPVEQVGDGVCDCCDGSDKDGTTPPCAAADQCDARLQAALAALEAVAAAHERGVRQRARIVEDAGPPSALRKKLGELAKRATTMASAAENEMYATYSALQREVARGVRPNAAAVASFNALQERAVAAAQLANMTALHAAAGYGADDAWMSMLRLCASATPVSEKVTKGGCLTPLPKRYGYRVCFGVNASQAEFLPDEWTRADRATRREPLPRDAFVVRPDGTTAPANRTAGAEVLLGRWAGYIPLAALDDALWATALRYDGVAGRQGVVVPPPPSPALPRGADVADAVSVYLGLDTCVSEGMSTTRKAYVMFVCPGVSPAQHRTLQSLHAALAVGTGSGGGASRVDKDDDEDGWDDDEDDDGGGKGQVAADTGLGLPARFLPAGDAWNVPPPPHGAAGSRLGNIVHVHEDGLCAYKLYVASPLACSARLARAARSTAAALRARAASR